MNVLNDLGINKEQWEEVAPIEVNEGYKPLESGVYNATVKEVAYYTTDNGAVQLKIVLTVPELLDHELTQYQNIKKRNGEVNEIGERWFKGLFDATNTDINDTIVEEGEFEAYGSKKKGKIIRGLTGKPLKALVRAVHEEGAKFPDYNEFTFARIDGTNGKGEDIVSKFKETIEKVPVLQRTAKNQQGGSQKEVKTSSGQDVKDLL